MSANEMKQTDGNRGFTILEVLVASAVLMLLLVLLLSATNQTMSTVRTASARVNAFQAARAAFDIASQKVSQATMNTYWDYYDSANKPRDPTSTNSANFQPYKYGRKSDLHFLVQTNSPYGQALFFEAPEAMSADATRDQTQGLLNAIGYFVQYGSDKDPTASWQRPAVLPDSVPLRYRYRLMQAIQPTENFQVFATTNSDWTTVGTNAVKASAWPLADNVIALIVWPRLNQVEDPTGTTITSNYQYNSRTNLTGPPTAPFPLMYAQAPPTVQLTMVVLDETSAVRLNCGATAPSDISNALAGKFTDATQYQADLDDLTSKLAAKHLGFRVFNTTVSLRESKWSSQ